MPNKEVNKKIAKGAIWMVAMRLSMKTISIVSTMILARLLSPDDFGLMALASSVYAFIELIRAFGFDTVLIQNQKASHTHYDTAWTMQVFFSITCAAIIVLVSKSASIYFDDYRLHEVLSMMAVIIIINGFENIGVVDFRKKFAFNKEFTYKIIVKFSGFIVTIFLAWYWRNYWALLFGIFTTNVISLILSYTMHSYRPSITLKAWKEILGFSSWLFINNILLFFNQHSQNFILGKIDSANSVGLFAMSNEIASIARAEIVAPMNRAAYPGYAQIADNIGNLKDTYLKVISKISLIAIPSSIGVYIVAPVLVPVLLGDGWLNAIETMQFLALANTIICVDTNTTYILLALKKQYINTIIEFLRVSLFTTFLFLFIPIYGVAGAGISLLLVSIIIFPINLLILRIKLNVKLLDLMKILYRPIISSLLMVYCVNKYFELTSEVSIVVLLCAISVGVLSFVSSLVLQWMLVGRPDSDEKLLLGYIRNKSKKVFAR